MHWLPVQHRITFKKTVTVYKCLHGLAPPYLTEYCTSTSFDAGRRHLRSAYNRQLIIPRTRTSYGDRSFAVHGPVVWNSLTHDLRSTDLSLATFRNRLKTFLFDTDRSILLETWSPTRCPTSPRSFLGSRPDPRPGCEPGRGLFQEAQIPLDRTCR